MRKRSVLIGVIAAVSSAVGALGLPAVAAADTASPQGGAHTQIVGGHNATQQYSFMVSLQQQGQHICGASLIKPDWAVTAAHCVEGGQPGDFQVRVGSNNNSSGGETAGLKKITVHPSGDIAVFQLDKQVQAQPISIAPESGSPGTKTRIIGWGQTCPEPGGCGIPTQLKELDTSIIPDGQCTGIQGPTELCTDNPGGDAGACYGDSGGPQIKGTEGNWQLVGATSRSGNGDQTCATGPSIYTDVSAYADWVSQNTGG